MALSLEAGGEREGGSRLLCPQAGLEWALQAEARQGRGLGEHLSLPPLSSTLLLVPFSFSHIPPLPSPTFHTPLHSHPPHHHYQDHSYSLGSPMHVLGRHSVPEVAGGILGHSRISHCETENITED